MEIDEVQARTDGYPEGIQEAPSYTVATVGVRKLNRNFTV